LVRASPAGRRLDGGYAPKPPLKADGGGASKALLEAARRILASYGAALAASAVLGVVCVRAIRADAHEPAAPLDDAFIHLQFARGLAHGHFFEYVAGEGYSSGATSLLWPMLLAPFHAIGLHDVSLLWAAWLLGTIAHAGTAVEAYRLTRRMAGDAAALGAAAMCTLFGAFAWFAWSGMETMALAWVLLRVARAAGARFEPERGSLPTSTRELTVLGIVAPLIRPEGALASLMAAVALLRLPAGDARRRRVLAFAPLIGPLLAPLLNLAFTGRATSATTQVKWMIGNPYWGASAIFEATVANARMLVDNLMAGGDWTVIFLPEHANVPILLGLVALPITAFRRRVPYHALFTAAVALGTLIPCTYLTFLWNRIRYVWPFAGSWFVLAACFAREVGDLARLVRPRLAAVTPLLAGGFAAALGLRLPWAVRDLANSARAIARQQVTLGRWASAELPADARIGVNDTGAIAYLSNRKTFDVVGLTTEGEARFWVAGAGSRFEHYEKMPAARRPTHFIVYPHWMACNPVLGRELSEETVNDQSILGGATMVAYEARWDLLGSGALPASPPEGLTLADEVDVADLESEAGHAYERITGWDADNVVNQQGEDHPIADGGRLRRVLDRFRVKLPGGARRELWMRVSAEVATDLVVTVGGREAGVVPLEGDGVWSERSVPIPAELSAGDTAIAVRARAREGGGDARFGSFHYWVFTDAH
jgi:hypothetical protein